MFSVDWTQHAAGHGGFHSGRAAVGSDPGFNWIFDCGAKNASKFDRLMRTWTMRNQEPVHWLFVSHFDADHVSGLDTLMSQTVVRDVMVPYVNERELAFSSSTRLIAETLSAPSSNLSPTPAPSSSEGARNG